MRQLTEKPNPLTDAPFDSAYLKIACARLFKSKYWMTAKKRLGLSNREIQVGVLLTKGLSTVEIAEKLGCGTGTVRSHIKTIKQRMAVSSRVQVVVKLILATGILTEDIE